MKGCMEECAKEYRNR